MKVLQKATTCLLGALTLLSPSYGEIKINDMLSLSGFVDMSYVNKDLDSGADDKSLTLDQVEMDFMFDFGEGFSAQVDLEAQSDAANTGNEYSTDIEQAFFNYQLTDNFSVKAGRFLSYTGWETEEPTGLFQYSGTGYAGYFYGGYQQGVSVMYSGAMIDLGLSVVDDLYQTTGTSGNADHLGVEVMLALYPTETITVKAFYLTDRDVTDKYTIKNINAWASYAVGGFTFAAEYNTADNSSGANTDQDGYLLMANYAWDKYGITFRYHGWDVENNLTGTKTEEVTGFTIAPSMTVNEYLLLVAEYRSESDDVGTTPSKHDYDQFALEALVTF